MIPAPFVDSLLHAVSTRASGWLWCLNEEGADKVALKAGAVVADSMLVGFGWQGLLASLLQSRSAGPQQVDALWALGETGALAVDTCTDFNLTHEQAAHAMVLANVVAMARRAESVRFEPADIGDGPTVNGFWLASELMGLTPAVANHPPGWYRIVDGHALSQWEVPSEQSQWLEQFGAWSQPAELTPARQGLLHILTAAHILEFSLERPEPVNVTVPPPVEALHEAAWSQWVPETSEQMPPIEEALQQATETTTVTELEVPQVAAVTAPLSGDGPAVDELFKLAETSLRKREFRLAEERFAQAFARDPSAHTLAAQAWCIYLDPSRKSEASKARQLMHHALSLNAQCDRAHYQLGVIARVDNDIEKAEWHFREAVRANAQHLEANQELRLIELRKRKAADAKKGSGLFG